MRGLTHKQRLFIDAYLGKANGNATRAALMAGYSEKTAYSIGGENLSKPEIKEAIRDYYVKSAMGPEEVISRLGEQARNEITTYVKENGALDLPRLIADGKAHLIKKISFDKEGRMEIESFDAQAALVHIGRHQKLFTDRVENDNPGINEAIERGLAELARLQAAGAPRRD